MDKARDGCTTVGQTVYLLPITSIVNRLSAAAAVAAADANRSPRKSLSCRFRLSVQQLLMLAVQQQLLLLLLLSYHSAAAANLACNGTGPVILSDIQGNVSLLSADYSNSVECQWLIVATSPAKSINIQFVSLNTECSSDFLYVYDGPSADSQYLLGSYSGSTQPTPVYAVSGRVLVYFRSDSSGVPSSGGFNLTYSASSCPLDCSGNGECIGGVCVCNSGHSGPTCTVRRCRNSTDCSSHGSCIVQPTGLATCECLPPYVGWDCSLMLDGTTSGDSNSSTVGQWAVVSPAGSGPRARAGHGMAYDVQTNSLYVFAGRTAGAYLNSLLVYNMTSNSWSQLGSSASASQAAVQQRWPSARHGHRVVLASGMLYTHGGLTFGEQPTAELWAYNVRAGMWVALASSPAAMTGHTLTVIDGDGGKGMELYAFGGHSVDGTIQSEIYAFNITSGTWRTVVPRGSSVVGGVGPRLTGHSAVYHRASDSLLIYGGFSTGATSGVQLAGRLYAFSLRELYWSELAFSKSSSNAGYLAPPAGFAHHSAVLMGNYMVVYGGVRPSTNADNTCYGCSKDDSMYGYHLGCHRWVTLSSLETAAGIIQTRSGSQPVVTGGTGRYGHAAILARGNVLLIGGGFAGTMLSDFIAYKVPLAVASDDDFSRLHQEPVCSSYIDNSKCTVDPECAWCTNTGTCLSRVNVTSCPGSVSYSFCPGVCAALLDCGACTVQGHQPASAAVPSALVQSERCVWCTKESSCQRSSALSRTCLSAGATPSSNVGWWNGTSETASSLSQCLSSGPPAGLYWALYAPPQNYDLPDQVFFSSVAGISVNTGGLSPPCCYVMRTMGWAHTLNATSLWGMYMSWWGTNVSLQLANGSDFNFLERVASGPFGQSYTAPVRSSNRPLLPNISRGAAYALKLTAVWSPSSTIYGAALYWQFPRSLSLITYEYLQPYSGGNCSSYVSCLACLIDASCAWCASSPSGSYRGTCVAKSYNTSCTEAGSGQFQWPLLVPQQCATCDVYTDCLSCLLDAACAWNISDLSCVRKGVIVGAVQSTSLCPQPCSRYTNSSSCIRNGISCSWCYVTARDSSIYSSSNNSALAQGCGFCMPETTNLFTNTYGQCQPLLSNSNQMSIVQRDGTFCQSCALAGTCSECMLRAGCGWCSSGDNPLVGTCTAAPQQGPGGSAPDCSALVAVVAASRNVTLSSNWTAVWSPTACPLVNECILAIHDCLVNATCVDTAESFRCQCPRGFIGDGRSFCNRTCYETCVHGVCSGAPSFVCLCDLGWTGANCSTDCGCNYHSACDLAGVGHCDRCMNGTAGQNCQLCDVGTYGNATQSFGCQPCECNGHGDKSKGTCNSTTGACFCTDNTMGAQCGSCQNGYYGDPRNGGACYRECYGRTAATSITGNGGVGSYSRNQVQSFCIWTLTVFPDTSGRYHNGSYVPTISIAVRGLRSECLKEYLYIFDGLLPSSVTEAPPAAVSGYKVALCGSIDAVQKTSLSVSSGYATIYFFANQNTSSGFNISYSVNTCPDNCRLPNRYCDAQNSCVCSAEYGGNDCLTAVCPLNCSGNGSCLPDGTCACWPGHAGPSCSEYNGLSFGVQPVFSMGGFAVPLPAARVGHTVVTCDGGASLLLFGGRSAELDLLGDLWLYNGSSRRWEQLLPPRAASGVAAATLWPEPRYHHAAACVAGSSVMVVYGGLVRQAASGGSKQLTNSNDTWLFSSDRRSWSRLNVSSNNMPSVAGHTLTVLNDTSLLLLGGYGQATGYYRGAAVLRLMNTSSGQWASANPTGVTPPGLLLHTAVYVTALNSVYVHGGYPMRGARRSNMTTYVLNMEHMLWNVLQSADPATAPLGRFSHASADISGSYMIVLGGLNDFGINDYTMFAYAYRCNQWFNVTTTFRETMNLLSGSLSFTVKANNSILIVGSSLASLSTPAAVRLVWLPSDLCLLVNKCPLPTLESGTSDACSACPSAISAARSSTPCSGNSNFTTNISCFTNASAVLAVAPNSSMCALNGSQTGCSSGNGTNVTSRISEFPSCNSSLLEPLSCGLRETCSACLIPWSLVGGVQTAECQWCETSAGAGRCTAVGQYCPTLSQSSNSTVVTTLTQCPNARCQLGSDGSSTCNGCQSLAGCAWMELNQQTILPGLENGWTCKNASYRNISLPSAVWVEGCPSTCASLKTCMECTVGLPNGVGESLVDSNCYWSTTYGQCLSDADVVLQCADGRCGRLADSPANCPAADTNGSCILLTSCASCMGQPWCGWCAISSALSPNATGRGVCLDAVAGATTCNTSELYVQNLFDSNSPVKWTFMNESQRSTYAVAWNLYQCPPENECLNGHSTCNPITEVCVDTTLSYECDCQAGYNRSADGSPCYPVCDDPCVHGFCAFPNTCRCDFGFVGHNCSVACLCNGHGQCPDENNLTVCKNCSDNTMGDQCQFCLPNFVGNGSKNCTPCYDVCHGHATTCTSSVDQLFPPLHGPISVNDTLCACTDNSTGQQCESCIDGLFRLSIDDACEPCLCNGRGSTCNPRTGSGCPCSNNTRSPCGDDDSLCFLYQCSECASSYVGSPVGDQQCYLAMSATSMYCLDPTAPGNCTVPSAGSWPSSVNTSDSNASFLPFGQGVLFAAKPQYINVDLRIYMEIQEGGVDVYITKYSDLMLMKTDPQTGWLTVEWNSKYRLIGNATTRKKRSAAVGLIDLKLHKASASEIYYFTVSEPQFLLLVQNVTRRLAVTFPERIHNLTDDKFYILVVGRGKKARTGGIGIENYGGRGFVFFKQDQPLIIPFVFVCVFFSSFLMLLTCCLIVWIVKQHFERRRLMAERAKQLVKMAARPYSTVIVVTSHESVSQDSRVQLNPLAIEPLEDGVSAVATVMMRLPSTCRPGACICMASTLTALKQDRVAQKGMLQ